MKEDFRRSRVQIRSEHPDPLEEAEAAARKLRKLGSFDDEERPTRPDIQVTVNMPHPQPSQPEIGASRPDISGYILPLVGLAIAGLGRLIKAAIAYFQSR